MVLKNAKVFVDGKFEELDVSVENGKITHLQKAVSSEKENQTSDSEVIDCLGKMIWPGLFDIHTHGCLGYDFSKSNPDEMKMMCEFYAAHGVTSILATTMTNEDHQYSRAMGYLGEVIEQQKSDAGDQACIRGINMEGPFFGTEKKGAHDEQYLRPVSQKLTDEYQNLSGNAIRLLDIDPTLPGALEFIQANKDKLTVSIAHTNCDYETAKKAVKAGATHVTHLFNAMRPMLHREPGLVGAAFELGLDAEIICDGIHIHPAVIHLMFSAMPDRMILISDSINPTGLPDGSYEAGGLPIQVKNHKAYLSDGTLAGSTITLFDGVKHAVEFGVPLEHALSAATSIPARSVGLEDCVGSIVVGNDADLLLVDENLTLERVMLRGRLL